MEGWLRFARCAEQAGIESVLLSFSRYEPDTLMVACAVGRATRKLKFIVAYRSGLMQPTTFVQQLNTLSGLIEGRVAVNIVAGSSTAEQRGYGDFLEHDERYARAEEFLAICHAFWRRQEEIDFQGNYFRVERGRLHTPYTAPERTAPEIYVSGHSPQAERLAACPGLLLVAPDRYPRSARALVARTRERGVEVCLRLGLICRPTREEAIRAAEAMLPDEEIGRRERGILANSDSQTLQGALATADNGRLDEPAPVGRAGSLLWIVGDHAFGIATRVV